MIDSIYLDYNIELKQFQAVIHKLMSENESFEQRLRDKEAEIVDDSIWVISNAHGINSLLLHK